LEVISDLFGDDAHRSSVRIPGQRHIYSDRAPSGLLGIAGNSGKNRGLADSSGAEQQSGELPA